MKSKLIDVQNLQNIKNIEPNKEYKITTDINQFDFLSYQVKMANLTSENLLLKSQNNDLKRMLKEYIPYKYGFKKTIEQLYSIHQVKNNINYNIKHLQKIYLQNNNKLSNSNVSSIGNILDQIREVDSSKQYISQHSQSKLKKQIKQPQTQSKSNKSLQISFQTDFFEDQNKQKIKNKNQETRNLVIKIIELQNQLNILKENKQNKRQTACFKNNQQNQRQTAFFKDIQQDTNYKQFLIKIQSSIKQIIKYLKSINIKPSEINLSRQQYQYLTSSIKQLSKYRKQNLQLKQYIFHLQHQSQSSSQY